MPAICWECNEPGHVAADCRNKAISGSDGKPPWCGICDERTRLIGVPGDKLARCQECHPLRHAHLRQHRRCPSCRLLVHEWDTAPCGHHSSPAATADTRPGRDHIDKIIAKEAAA
jgi:hypothetical protein